MLMIDQLALISYVGDLDFGCLLRLFFLTLPPSYLAYLGMYIHTYIHTYLTNMGPVHAAGRLGCWDRCQGN